MVSLDLWIKHPPFSRSHLLSLPPPSSRSHLLSLPPPSSRSHLLSLPPPSSRSHLLSLPPPPPRSLAFIMLGWFIFFVKKFLLRKLFLAAASSVKKRSHPHFKSNLSPDLLPRALRNIPAGRHHQAHPACSAKMHSINHTRPLTRTHTPPPEDCLFVHLRPSPIWLFVCLPSWRYPWTSVQVWVTDNTCQNLISFFPTSVSSLVGRCF